MTGTIVMHTGAASWATVGISWALVVEPETFRAGVDALVVLSDEVVADGGLWTTAGELVAQLTSRAFSFSARDLAALV